MSAADITTVLLDGYLSLDLQRPDDPLGAGEPRW
jgi:hypothetical protein